MKAVVTNPRGLPVKIWVRRDLFGNPEALLRRRENNDVLYLNATELRNAISRIPSDRFDYWEVLKVLNSMK